MTGHAGGFLGEISDRPDPPEEFAPRPSDEGQRDPNEPILPGQQPEQTRPRDGTLA